MNASPRHLFLAALVAPLLFAAAPSRAIDITITNNGASPGTDPCVLHMGTAPGDVLQTDPNGAPGDLMVAGTYSTGDPCITGGQVHPVPTGSVALPPGTIPTANQAFPVNWTATNATKCTFAGTGWSGDACGGTAPACNLNGTSGTRNVTLAQGSYDFGLSCTNGVDPAVIVADPTFVVGPELPSTCGYGTPVAGASRQLTGTIAFLGSPVKFQSQPLIEWGAMFGITRTCTPDGDTCPPPWPPFPEIVGNAVVVTAQTSQYLSLAFTTASLNPNDLSGSVSSLGDSIATPGTEILYSISDRCGDFDAVNSPWLQAHPACILNLGQKSNFPWVSAASNLSCSFRRNGILDPNQVWYLNMKITRCNNQTGTGMPSQCQLYMSDNG